MLSPKAFVPRWRFPHFVAIVDEDLFIWGNISKSHNGTNEAEARMLNSGKSKNVFQKI